MEWKLSQSRINQIVKDSAEKIWEPFPGITIVAWQLPNGFVISDQSGCIDPKDYDRDIGIEIARKHLEDKVWQLYGFARKQEYHNAKVGDANGNES